MIAAGLLVVFLLAPVLARPTPDLVVRGDLGGPPAGFTAGNAPSDAIKFTLALPQVDVNGLHAAVLDVSDPTSAKYRQHLSKAEVEKFVAPRAESVDAVTQWLNKNGITPTPASTAGDLLEFTVSVDKANDLLNANFTPYVHESTNTTMMRTLSYALPSGVQDHVSYIYPTTHFIPPVQASIKSSSPTLASPRRAFKRMRSRRDISTDCNPLAVSPSCIQELYNIPSSPATQPNNSLFVTAFGLQVALPSDTQQFLTEFRPDIDPNTQVNYVFTDNFQYPQSTDNHDEANFDVQITVGLATNVPVTFITRGNETIQLTDFLGLVNFLLGQDEVPAVMTTSYDGLEVPGGAGNEDIAVSLCNAVAQLGARGTSVIWSSGDGGVGGSSFGAQDCELGANQFQPTFPSGCPFITSVGATQGIPETAAPYSSGGFSNIFPRPDYQNDAINAYLQALGDINQGQFNTTGRAYPDVSMIGTNASFILNGLDNQFTGTSVAAPSFAAVIALLNDQLLAAGQPVLGFLNPLIYQAAAAGAFNDITTGNNGPACGSQVGFPAAPGWDPVTGVGTPNFAKLLALAMSNTERTPPPTGTQATSEPASTNAPASTTGAAPPVGTTTNESAGQVIASLVSNLLTLLEKAVGA